MIPNSNLKTLFSFEMIIDTRRPPLGVNYGFWSQLGCPEQNATISSHQGIFDRSVFRWYLLRVKYKLEQYADLSPLGV